MIFIIAAVKSNFAHSMKFVVQILFGFFFFLSCASKFWQSAEKQRQRVQV